jgi:hypothetical protein
VEGDFFLTGKGLRQGDPLAPLLFNTVVDVFSRMLIKGANVGLIRGLCPNLISDGVISLQYADGTYGDPGLPPRIPVMHTIHDPRNTVVNPHNRVGISEYIIHYITSSNSLT